MSNSVIPFSRSTIDSDDNEAVNIFSGARTAWNLTKRQGQVLALVARGLTNALIAESLGIAERTVEFHVTAVFDKAGVDNRATLIARAFALEAAAISPPPAESELDR